MGWQETLHLYISNVTCIYKHIRRMKEICLLFSYKHITKKIFMFVFYFLKFLIFVMLHFSAVMYETGAVCSHARSLWRIEIIKTK
jgi:hypothetical protein